ncbi:MAG: glycosyltransferase family 39 protein [Thermoanaerobaculia bacterium]|nr:glycosyltransferase family 39 protein [Thermoanaerobaculia bacterium]
MLHPQAVTTDLRGRARQLRAAAAAAVPGLASGLRRRAVVSALAVLLLAGLWARGQASREGLPYLHHWDEPFVANRALRILQTGDFNPRFFNYGSLRIYLDAAVDVAGFYRLATRGEEEAERLDSVAQIGFRGAREDDLVTDPARPPWSVSHPTFYLWNRYLTAVFGIAAAALAFLLARALGGPAAGLFAAATVALNPFHIEQSSYVTTDVPASVFALAALLATLAFADRHRPRDLLLAGVAVGLATATKYNAAVVGLVPAAALAVAAVRRSPGTRRWLWFGLPASAAISFLAATPYALLDLPTFLDHTARMLRSYVVERESLFAVEPGWPHFATDLAAFTQHLGPILALAAVAGLVFALRRPRAWIVLPIGLVVLAATAATRANFHRNLVLCYPLAGVAAGLLFAACLPAAAQRRTRTRAVLAVVLLAGLAQMGAAGLHHGWHRGRLRETRSQIVDRLAAEGAALAGSRLGVAREVGLHELDLARLHLEVEVRGLRELLCAPHAEDLLLLPTRPAAGSPIDREALEDLSRLVAASGPPLLAVAPENPLSLDAPIADPGLALYPAPPAGAVPVACAAGGVRWADLTLAGGGGTNERTFGLAPGAVAMSPGYALPDGALSFAVEATAVDAGAGSELEVEVVTSLPAPGRVLERARLPAGRTRRILELSVPGGSAAGVALRLSVPPDASSGVLLHGIWVAPAGP